MDTELSEFHFKQEMDKSLLTPDFLHWVEIWSRYSGPDFTEFNTHIKDRGTIKIHGGKLCDATEIYNSNSSYMGYSRFLIMCEQRRDKEESKLSFDLFPPVVYIYIIDEAYIEEGDDESSHYPDLSKYTQLPTFERLKSDLEDQEFSSGDYTSLIYDSSSQGLDYELYKPNSNTDRLQLFFTIRNELNNLNDRQISRLGKTIENTRVTRDVWMEEVKKLTDKTE